MDASPVGAGPARDALHENSEDNSEDNSEKRRGQGPLLRGQKRGLAAPFLQCFLSMSTADFSPANGLSLRMDDG